MRSIFFLILTIAGPMAAVVSLPIVLMPHCDTLDGYNKTNSTLSIGKAQACVSQANETGKIFGLLMLPLLLIPLIGMIRWFLIDDDDEEDKKLIKQLKNEIPTVEKLVKIPCALCSKNVDRPYNLIKHLGIEQTKQYLSFCDESKTEPTLYCCKCYAMVERNPNWQKAMDNMIDDSIKYGELKKINLMKTQEERIN